MQTVQPRVGNTAGVKVGQVWRGPLGEEGTVLELRTTPLGVYAGTHVPRWSVEAVLSHPILHKSDLYEKRRRNGTSVIPLSVLDNCDRFLKIKDSLFPNARTPGYYYVSAEGRLCLHRKTFVRRNQLHLQISVLVFPSSLFPLWLPIAVKNEAFEEDLYEGAITFGWDAARNFYDRSSLTASTT